MAQRGELYEGVVAGRRQTVLVVSGDDRNRSWPSVLVVPVVRMVGDLDLLDSTVALGDAEPAEGTVMADNVFPVELVELTAGRGLGAITAEALHKVNGALLAALGLT